MFRKLLSRFAGRSAADVAAPVAAPIIPHPIFTKFTPFSGVVPPEEMGDWTGVRFLRSWSAWAEPEGPIDYAPFPMPNYDEEYFEFVDVLEAVDEAQDTFTCVELGAGWGRWALRGAKAAEQRGLKSHLALVECEPIHAQWCRDAIAMNPIEGMTTELHEVAVAYNVAEVPIVVICQDLTPATFYGQGIEDEPMRPSEGRTYEGRPVSVGDSGFGYIHVPAKPLEEIIGHLTYIDLLDADLQRAERGMVENSMPFLNARVRRVHIGTHPGCDDLVRQAFRDNGWREIWDFRCHQQNPTPYGLIDFVDGVSSWVNPRFDDPASRRRPAA